MDWGIQVNASRTGWASDLARITVRHPWRVIGIVAVVTVVALWLTSSLGMRMNWTDLLPGTNPAVVAYNTVQNRFGEATIIIALEGDRDRTVRMASELEPRLRALDLLYNVDGKAPIDFLSDHGFVLLKPNDFDRALRIYDDPGLVGVLRGLNDDYEREYNDSDQNIKRDEVDIARSLLGLTRSLEVISANLSGDANPPQVSEAVQTMLIGDPWPLSLDRRMLLLFCTPISSLTQFDSTITAVEQVQAVIKEVSPEYPDVTVGLTGMGKVAQDEMNSIGLYTQILTLISLILIFLLLARSFRGWLTPIIALVPLVVGIVWTTGVARILFGTLNIFTVMIMLVLLGLGIDFSIHLLSRFYEERGNGKSIDESAMLMLGDTGLGVITGALTTAAAFFALMIARTDGVFEFGAAAGAGVLLTLAAVFVTLPALIALRERRHAGHDSKRAIATAHKGWPVIGYAGVSVWRWHWLVLAIFVVLAGWSLWGAWHTAFEYDWLNLEPEGLISVALEREIPKRYGLSEHTAWTIAPSIEAARELKEKLRKLPVVGDVNAISDAVPPAARVEEYAPRLIAYQEHLKDAKSSAFSAADLLAEINRLWDNLDLMSNLAFQAGLDRIVRGIDQMTGYDAKLDWTDSSAVLPRLVKIASSGIDTATAATVANAWESEMRASLIKMANPALVGIDDLPDELRRSYLPRDGGEGNLVHIVPRKYLYNKPELDRFTAQTDRADPSIIGTPELFMIMMDETLRDGRDGALLALLVIVVLLLVHFRSAFGLLALIPLVGGALLMLGIMHMTGMKYNYVNLIAVPIILGIGIDDGVHLIHRWRSERGSREKRVGTTLRFVGRAVLLTSLTTMIGFGSVALYEMRGLASFGLVLFIGVGLCFLTTVLVLPAVLRSFTRASADDESKEG